MEMTEITYSGPAAAHSLWGVAPIGGITCARFLGLQKRRSYYCVEMEDGQPLVVYGNDIRISKGMK